MADPYDPRVRIAIASFSGVPPGFDDDARLAAALRAQGADVDIQWWDDPAAEWESHDLVVIRSTWNYQRRHDEFLAWVDRVGDRIHNSPALVRWNSDKRYLGDLASAGLAVVETCYLEPGDAAPELDGEVVVKPNVSAGGRDTGRFGPGTHAAALELIGEIHRSARTAMVQPYEPSVDTAGETAILFVDGEPAHALLKRAVLRPDEVAPVRDDAVGAAEIMYDPALVTKGDASPAQLEHARAVVAHVSERFGYVPLYTRVDSILRSDGEPVLMELEAIEPNFYLNQAPATAALAADAILARAEGK